MHAQTLPRRTHHAIADLGDEFPPPIAVGVDQVALLGAEAFQEITFAGFLCDFQLQNIFHERSQIRSHVGTLIRSSAS